MKRFFSIGLMVLATALFAGSASAVTITDYNAGDAANGIGKSRHNLGSMGSVMTTDATSEICVFCHTPHHSNTGVTAPLWNRSTEASSSYTAYGTTIAGSYIGNGDLSGATLACLSCHDGVTTFDNLVNRPGKDTKGGDFNWTWRMPNIGFAIEGTSLDHFTTSTPCSVCHQEGAGTDVQARLIIGTSLSNDHPVSVPYQENVASLRTKSTDIASIDLSTDTGQFAGGDALTNVSQNRWAVKGFISTTASINDLLRDDKVECSSCHDPHFRNLSWDEVDASWADGNFTTWCNNDPEVCSDGMFLRRIGGNTGSGVCRTCHNK